MNDKSSDQRECPFCGQTIIINENSYRETTVDSLCSNEKDREEVVIEQVLCSNTECSRSSYKIRILNYGNDPYVRLNAVYHFPDKSEHELSPFYMERPVLH